MHLFINSLAASAGGGITYIRNVVPHLAASPELQVTIALPPLLRQQFQTFPNIHFLELLIPTARRYWYEQSMLPGVIRDCSADVLLSAGNFALRKPPVPQILLSRNSIYTSDDFYRDLLSRREFKMWLDTHLRGALAKRSITWADQTVAPSEAFAEELTRWTGIGVRCIHHGFDRNEFTSDLSPLSQDIEEKLRSTDGSLKLLFASHYNYYRNFETLIRALPLLRDRFANRPLKLLLTCKLSEGANPGSYSPRFAAKLIQELAVADMIVELGTIPYSQLHQIYRRSDIYVTPAYTETFAHPLVEAMSSGLPVVASDLPVHREICEDAALYFSRFDPKELATRVAEIASSPGLASRLSAASVSRSATFSWRKHTDALLSLAHSLV